MKFDKIPHQLVLLMIAFWVGFFLGLIFYKGRLQAFYAGLISVATVGTATWGTQSYRRYQNMIIYDELTAELDELEAQESEIYQSLNSANLMRQELETRIENLDKEKVYLLDTIGKLTVERRKLADDVHSLQVKDKYHQDIYASKYQNISYLENQQEELSFKLELLETAIDKKQQQLTKIEKDVGEFEQSQQALSTQKNQLLQQVQELQAYYQQLTQNIEQIQQEKQNLERQFINEKKEIEHFKTIITESKEQQQAYNQILHSLEARKQELEANIQNLQKEQQQLTKLIETQQTELKNWQKPHVRFQFFPQEWQEWIDFCEQLNPLEKQLFQAILKEDSETIKILADQQTTMPQVLIDNLNQKALNQIGDTPFINQENSLIPRIQDEYLSVFQELLVIKFLDTLS